MKLTKEPITVAAIINGEKIHTEKKIQRENPTHPNEIVGYAPNNTREETIQAIDAAFNAFKTWAWTDVDDRINRMRTAIQKSRMQLLKLLNYYPVSTVKHFTILRVKSPFLLCGWSLPVIMLKSDSTGNDGA